MKNDFIPISKPYISTLEEEKVLDAVQSGWVSSLGEYIVSFENAFAAYCGVKYALTTSNGTTGLHLALASINIGSNDEVIVPDLTFVATANAVIYTGATPVFVDIDSTSNCISAEAIEAAITSRTRAIILVHLYGHPADMNAINELASKYDLDVIEDAAEAHGARYEGRPVGGLGRCGVFSFYGNKIITTGEGGMLTTNDEELYKRAKNLRDHAMSKDRTYWHAETGYNYRMTNLQAAIGVAQLEQIDEFLEKRNTILNWYRDAIDTSDVVRLNPSIEGVQSVNWMSCLEVDWFNRDKRSKFMTLLRKHGIDSRPYFCAMSSMPMFSSSNTPIAQFKATVGLNLPTFIEMTQEDVSRVAETVNKALVKTE